MRRNLLLQLTVAVFLPSLGAFLLAWIGFCQFENTMEGIAGSYVQNLARGAAARLESSQWDLRTDGTWQPNQYRSRILGLSEMMDDEIREELARELSPCTDQEFFAAYEAAHAAKYGEAWELSNTNPCY